MTSKKLFRGFLFLVLASTVLPFYPVSAQETSSDKLQTLSLKVAFRQGKRQIDPTYMENSVNISAFTATLRNYTYDSTLEVVSVDIIGGASIEGSAELNRDLSNNRASRMVEILRQYAIVPQNLVHVNSRGVNWEDVIEMVEADILHPSRERVLDILRNTPEPTRKSELQALEGGVPYNYMYEHIFPYVRTGKMTVTFRAVPKQPQTPAPAPVAAPAPAPSVHDTIVVVHKDTVYHVYGDGTGYARNINQNIMNVNTDGYGRKRGRPRPGSGEGDNPEEFPVARIQRADRLDSLLRTPLFALRSNLFIPLMNIGAEVPLGNRWSVSADWNYPWMWRLPDHKDCFEFLGGTAELRYWLGWKHRAGDRYKKYRLLGHSFGIVVGGGYYDFQKNWAGFQGEYGAAGLDYQFAMPLGKRARTHLEFDITLGAISSRNIPYDVFTEGGILLHRDGIIDYWHWYGPIKGGVSLVVPIYSKKDGKGRRGANQINVNINDDFNVRQSVNAGSSVSADQEVSASRSVNVSDGSQVYYDDPYYYDGDAGRTVTTQDLTISRRDMKRLVKATEKAERKTEKKAGSRAAVKAEEKVARIESDAYGKAEAKAEARAGKTISKAQKKADKQAARNERKSR